MKKRLAAVITMILIVAIALVAHGHHKTNVVMPKTVGSYVALGDSVAAGAGLATNSDPSACDRTNEAYPNLVAAHLHYHLKTLACSGATLSNGILGAQNVNELNVAPQLQQLFAQPRPQLISVTIGANDVDWTALISKCYSGECGSADDTAQVNQRLVVVARNLQTLLSQIQQHYGAKPPTVVVTGYHQVFPTNASSCVDLTNIDSSELAWGRQMQASISNTLQTTAQGYSFAKFVPVDFGGHELCTANSWVQSLSDTNPYHPTAAGQIEFANQIEKVVQL